ncbi:MAG: SagB family peptide dehydrogenase [Sedimentisphaerales bacterium]|jgi:SagB-type dehydrogenase family enzyme
MRLSGDSKILNGVLSASCCLAVLLAITLPAFGEAPRRTRSAEAKAIQLPEPNNSGTVSLETAINTRRSAQQFADKPLNYTQIGQLLWAGQGIIDKQQELRAAPSADDLYPIELYLVTSEGLFAYNPEHHSLSPKQISTLNMRKQLSVAASGQELVESAACNIIIASSIRKAMTKYGNKAQRFVLLEAGYVAENIQLQASSMGLTSLSVGSFEPRNIARICELPAGEIEPLLIVCVGYPFVQQKTQEQVAVQTTKKAVIITTVAPPDAELADILRVLKEAGIIPVVVTSKIGVSQGTFGGIVASEITFDNLNVADFDAVVFIGGLGDVDYFNNPAVLGIARDASARNKVIAAISNATMILADAGDLRGIRATGLPQHREQMKKAGAQYTGSAVERDGPIITANDSSVAVQFARAIVTAIKTNQPKSDKTPAK